MAVRTPVYTVRYEENQPIFHSQVECSPLCELEWVVAGEVITGEEEDLSVVTEELEEDGEQFTSVFTTLNWIHLDTTRPKFDVTCRVKSYSGLPFDGVSSSSAVDIECEFS